jgi:hypothetical protein
MRSLSQRVPMGLGRPRKSGQLRQAGYAGFFLPRHSEFKAFFNGRSLKNVVFRPGSPALKSDRRQMLDKRQQCM